ncbi:hypothetical protein AKJ52_03050 [candidate division MSBL1 archaeon SCGC-AAA382C18]|uniref:Thioredoxin-like fold domain-containing protein n=1 Tax=candidate division MSBL1 archaeon SCGC-AAA382C18 TaxID=1698281 RepID=A0A133VH62_9EURY|nr:hypothetical protein AKJ52_03050 [candidate division MSBL1 archaeon SCGC-AAA382C18]
MKIEILGPGCPNCEKLEEETKKAIEDLELKDIEVTKVDDPAEIAGKGVMNTPALAIDGEVKFSGRGP